MQIKTGVTFLGTRVVSKYKSTHTPTPEQIIEAVSVPFKASVEDIQSKSRKTNAVVAREVCAFLMRNRGLMYPPEICIVLGYKNDDWIKKIHRNVHGRARVDTDFAAMIWEAEKTLLKIY